VLVVKHLIVLDYPDELDTAVDGVTVTLIYRCANIIYMRHL